jgi:Protein of unknown function (DUF3107)
VDIRIGIVQSMKEIEIELPEDVEAKVVTKDVEKAIEGEGVLWLTDRKGRRVGVPASRIAYVEIGVPGADRKVGFGAQA